jgi:hypothetical protein
MVNKPASWMVAVGLADVLATYAYAFAAQALTPPSGPHAPVTYWMTQPWVYLLIAPVAAVATWQGLRQAAAVREGDRRWWRLPLTGAAIAAGVALPLSLVAQLGFAEAVLGITQVAAFGGGLGLLLTCINVPLVRLARTPSAAA